MYPGSACDGSSLYVSVRTTTSGVPSPTSPVPTSASPLALLNPAQFHTHSEKPSCGCGRARHSPTGPNQLCYAYPIDISGSTAVDGPAPSPAYLPSLACLDCWARVSTPEAAALMAACMLADVGSGPSSGPAAHHGGGANVFSGATVRALVSRVCTIGTGRASKMRKVGWPAVKITATSAEICTYLPGN